jgi:hypothetical protein
MAILDEKKNDKGVWLEARSELRAAVSAHLSNESAEALTLFWQGLAEYSAYEDFIRQVFIGQSRGIYWTPPIFAPPTLVRAQIFMDREKLTLKDLSPEQAVASHFLPPDARFIRLEFFAAQATHIAQPELITWGRLDLEQPHSRDIIPQALGVYINSERLVSVQEPIVAFIHRTLAPDAKIDYVSDCVQTLVERLRPEPRPRYTHA